MCNKQSKVIQNYCYEDIVCPDLRTLQLIKGNEKINDEYCF